MHVAGLLAILDAVLLVVVGQTLLKWGMNRVGPIGRARLAHPLALLAAVVRTWQVWAGVATYLVSAAAWLYGLSRVPLQFAAPMLAVTYIGVPLAATAVFDESLTPAQWLGVLLASTGVIVVALSR